jgi:hypothetical protein
VTSLQPTQAADASARLQQGVRSGLPVMIPGAWEVRDCRSIVPVIEAAALVQSSHAAGSVPIASDSDVRDRVGAPSQQRIVQRTILSKMWHYIIRSTDAPVL